MVTAKLKAVSYGLPKEEALKAITLYPVQILGVADRLGTLAVGEDATLIITGRSSRNHHPGLSALHPGSNNQYG